MDPPLDLPGVLAENPVGHDGGQAVGDFDWTLTVTDCTTGWTEAGDHLHPVPSLCNTHVQEKNNSVIRKFVGYDRHDTQEEVDLLNQMYQVLCLLVSWFLPGQKLLRKARNDESHITKGYEIGHRNPVHGCWHGTISQKRQRTSYDQ
jgi:hypothetical protein